MLVRQAVPGFAGTLAKRALFALAAGDGAESRLIERRPEWRVTPGPIGSRALSRLPARDWSLLVNDVNLHSQGADALMRQFAFLSWARLDDVMVSYATDGGGVGPHVDSYDVFLLQGPGRRKWRLMPPQRRPFGLVPGAPLKLIARFRPTLEMTLESGDMLYLPPGWGHDGIAMGECQTYSIGMRAPGGEELSAAFLDFLHERGFDTLGFRDPGRTPAANPARIDAHMIGHAVHSLDRIRWNRTDAARFLGRYLSEPRQQVFFEAPHRPKSRAQFMRLLPGTRVSLDPRTRMLTHGTRLYINGIEVPAPAGSRAALQELADRRELDGRRLAHPGMAELIFEWYKHGFLSLGSTR